MQAFQYKGRKVEIYRPSYVHDASMIILIDGKEVDVAVRSRYDEHVKYAKQLIDAQEAAQ